ncbi:MAG: hypothetical protein KBA61_08645 [Spirochaetes bacterium]|nr:hypothetical protein [Spirochaetota bacterium]
MKPFYPVIIMILALSITSFAHTGDFNRSIVEQIRLTDQDIPTGFIMGKIPGFAKEVFRDNPGYLSQAGIKRIAKHLYPNGSPSGISAIHHTIMAKSNTPFGDDIVCYIIVYANSREALKELKKLTDYAEFNKQRALVTSKENLAVFIHSDDKDNMPALLQLKRTIEERIEKAGNQ